MKKSYSPFARLALAATLLFAARLGATNYTFNTSGSWSNPANWGGGLVPPSPLPSGDAITISAGKTADLGGTQDIAAGATLTIAGTLHLLASATLDNHGTATVNGTLGLNLASASVNNYGTMEFNSFFPFVAGDLYNNGTMRFMGGVTIDRYAGLTNDNFVEVGTGTNSLDGGDIDNTGLFRINTGAIFDADLAATIDITGTGSLLVQGSFNAYDCTLTTGPSGSIIALGGFYFDGGGLENAGLVDIANTATVAVDFGVLHNSSVGTISTDAANFNVNAGFLLNEGLLDIGPGAKITLTSDLVNFSSTGTLNVDGTFDQAHGLTSEAGTVKGSGTVKGVCFLAAGSIIAPGSSPGCLHFQDPMKNSGRFDIEIGGSTVCSGYDKVSGGADLQIGEASLNVSFINGFVPTNGQTFDIMVGQSVVGTFTSVSITQPPLVTMTVSYLADRVRLVAAVLPIELVAFEAETAGKRIDLDWMTASETDNRGFFIEKSTDGKSWAEIGFVAGAGDSRSELAYRFSDESPAQGLNFYRLRQVDFDGASDFSPVATARFSKNRGGGIAVAPTVVRDGRANLMLGEVGEGELSVQIFAADGRLVLAEKFEIGTGFGQVPLDLTGLAAGVYAVALRMDGQVLPTARFVAE